MDGLWYIDIQVLIAKKQFYGLGRGDPPQKKRYRDKGVLSTDRHKFKCIFKGRILILGGKHFFSESRVLIQL